jgi:chromosome segregation ATPase
MKTNTKLTSVTVLEDVYKKFKVNTIDGSMNFQKMVNRTMDLYNKNEEFRALQLGDPSKIIAALNKSDAIFMAEVKKNLNLKGDAETIKETLSGRMFFAADAQKRGLIDGIKTKSEVIARAEQLAKQYSKSGRPKKGKKMANILAGTILGNALGIKEADEDAATLDMVQTKFTELEASASDLTTKLSESDTAKKAAELNAATLQARVAELEALNVTLSEKVLSVNTQAETLTAQVTTLETEKKNLSTQLAALTLKTSATSTAPNEVADSKVIESAAKKAFGGSVEVK